MREATQDDNLKDVTLTMALHPVNNSGRNQTSRWDFLTDNRMKIFQIVKKNKTERVHEEHLGTILYWTQMNSNMEEVVQDCSTCQK